MAVKCKIGDLSDTINKELTIYCNDVTEAINKESEKSIKELVEKTKATAPVGKRKKHYKTNIASKKVSESSRGATYVWYVKGSDYRLSHLLEHGHAKKNGGRVEGTHFISNAAEPIIEAYQKKIEEVIKNGG